MPTLYLAAPLFSSAELAFNKSVKAALSPFFTVYLPQEDGILLVDFVREGGAAEEGAKRVFTADTAAITSSVAVLAVLDGRSIDEGVAFELGFAYAIGRPCYGLQTDSRRLLPTGNNPMIEQCLTARFTEVEEAVKWAAHFRSS